MFLGDRFSFVFWIPCSKSSWLRVQWSFFFLY